ncbi:unnamed protein product [Menidia menidia]|uniref:(Atlantic silverside) hypothetical protein n=1 Tax=Menidia menidia TaxID=238744 RepID=A0A8S4BX13_9TELE|nr:unnamed protein product [Menidia menidia]
MEGRLLVVFSLLCGCVWLSEARLGSMRMSPYWAAMVQRPENVEAKPAAPERERFALLPRSAGRFHSKSVQPEDERFSWKFPDDPVDQVKRPPFMFQVQEPEVPSRVAVKCGESTIQVEVSQDLLGIGTLISPDEISLGGCPAVDIDEFANVLIFESELHDCGSTLEVKKQDFVYSFMLVYKPKMLAGSPIIRSQNANIKIECHYMNLQKPLPKHFSP